MPRKIKLPQNLSLDDATLWKNNKLQEIITSEFQLVTPLWGGGEKVNRYDSVSTIRTASIKGQLRFWWRTVRGWRANGDLQQLLKLEEDIWGGIVVAKQSSRVQLALEVLSPENPDDAFISAKDVPRYIAFPLLQGNEEDKEKALIKGVRFRLTLRIQPPPQKKGEDKQLQKIKLEEIKKEVNAALWAWSTFGGVGARTRRGFGAIELTEQSLTEIKKKLEEYSHADTKAWPKNVPHLTTKSHIAVVDLSWKEAIELYQRFRQYRPDIKEIIRRRGREVIIPGPNKWPEAALIRWAYAPRKYGKPNFFLAPRAQFGLPVPFYFLQDKKLGDDGKVTLTGKRQPREERIDRLASPLIIRPINKKRTLIAILEGPRTPPGGVYLDPKPKAKELSKKPIKTELAEEAEDLVAAGLDILKIGERIYTDPILAFWLCIQDKDCRERLEKVHTGR